MSNTTMVHLTLRSHVAERLRTMCHSQNKTASELVDRWILSANDQGKHESQDFFADLFAGYKFK